MAAEGFPAGTNGALGSVTWDGPKNGPGPIQVLEDNKQLLSHARAALWDLFSRRLMSSVLKGAELGSSSCPAQTWSGSFLSGWVTKQDVVALAVDSSSLEGSLSQPLQHPHRVSGVPAVCDTSPCRPGKRQWSLRGAGAQV